MSASSCRTIASFLVLLCIPCAWTAACPANPAPFTKPSDITAAEQVQYASLFTVHYYSTYKVIKYAPTLKFTGGASWGWPNPSQHGQTPPDIVLYQCGTTPPTSSFNDVSDDALFFSIPIGKSAIAMTPLIYFFELLSHTESIHAIDMTYISSPCVQLLEQCNPSIHSKNSGDTWVTLTSEAEIVFTSTSGTGASNTLKDVPFSMSFDSGILPRAEWIRFIAAFFNTEVEAGKLFAEIAGEYNGLKETALDLQKSSDFNAPPTVAWASADGCFDPNEPACDGKSPGQWVDSPAEQHWCRCGPYGWYIISQSLFKRDITTDAGARFLPLPAADGPNCTRSGGSDGATNYHCQGTPEGLAHFQQLLGAADVIIDETYMPNHGPYSVDDFVTHYKVTPSAVTAMVNEAVYRIDGSVSDPWHGDEGNGEVGSNWFDEMPVQPQELLSDMMHAVWGAAFQGPCALKYLRPLYGNHVRDPLEHSDCPYDDPVGNHDCAAIHDHLHSVHKCVPVAAAAASGSGDDDDDKALAFGLGFGIGIPLVLIIVGIAVYAMRGRSGTPREPNKGTVIGVPVKDDA